jgi:DNA polymerase I-like protein with 3'-5' exonuclease and polymerase domains
MLSLDNGSYLVESVGELPEWPGTIEHLYMDFETASYTPSRGGDSPYQGDRIAGIAVTADLSKEIFYVPIRHTVYLRVFNLEIPPVLKWMRDLLRRSKRWVNHNIKFDAHFARVDGVDVSLYGGDEALLDTELIDTLVLAKLINSDRMTYGLKPLAREWLGWSMPETDAVSAFLQSAKSKDHADVPPDIEGAYACMDVRANRALYEFLLQKKTEDISRVWETEKKLTPVLFDMECFGMPVNRLQLQIQRVQTLTQLQKWDHSLAQLIGHEFNPKSPPQMQDLMINEFGLPILAWNYKEGPDGEKQRTGPCFTKEVMRQYMVHPQVTCDPRVLEILSLITSYREEADFDSMFLSSYLNLEVDEILHPDFNQSVRTGRMSCRNPNAQQLNKRAKRLIRALKGQGILAADYSQIEFRLIGHYIEDAGVIKAYNEDPTTDFHSWVASVCHIKRKPAKTLNFKMAFGGGKASTIIDLTRNPDIIGEVGGKVNDIFKAGPEAIRESIAEIGAEMPDDGVITKDRLFFMMCHAHASGVYAFYHETLPGLKKTSYAASNVCKTRGYVFNAYGRRRHLPKKAAHRAFPSIIQSSAADLMKERTVAVAPRYNRRVREAGVNIFAVVHDDVSSMGPSESLRDPEFLQYFRSILEDPAVKFSIPILTGMGYSETDWAEASDDDVETRLDDRGRVMAGPIPR